MEARSRFVEGLSNVRILAEVGEQLQAQQHVLVAIGALGFLLDAITMPVMVMMVVMMRMSSTWKEKRSTAGIWGSGVIGAGDQR